MALGIHLKVNLLLVGVLLLVVLSLVLLSSSDYSTPQTEDFQAPSTPEYSRVPCESLDDSLLRDVCYLDDVKRGKTEQFLEYPVENCRKIENVYLQYVCLRLESRVHMLDFMTDSSTKLPSALPDAKGRCSYVEGFPRLYCGYTYVAGSAKENVDAARTHCRALPANRLVGECEFYIAVSLAMGFPEGTDRNVNSLMSFCEKVSHPLWRAECYYVIADELALGRPAGYPEGIARACTRSSEAADYGCFNHAAFLMPLEEGELYCDILEEEHRSECFDGLGASIADEFPDNFTAGVEQCDRFPAEYRRSCFDGAGLIAGWRSLDGGHSLEKVGDGMQKCDAVPESFVEDCSLAFAAAVGRRMVNDVPGGLEACALFPEKNRERCLYHLGWAIGQYHLLGGISAAIMECDGLPGAGRDSCLESLTDSIAENSVDDSALALENCGALPPGFEDECYSAVKQFLGKILEG